MVSKKSLPFVIPVVLLLVLVVAKSWGNLNTEPTTKYAKILTTVTELLEQGHYSPKKLDDNFSKSVFEEYIHRIDNDRIIFYAEDIAKLRKQFGTELDDEMRAGKVDFIKAVDDLYTKRLQESMAIFKAQMAKPFDFTVEESIQLSDDEAPYAASKSELTENWRKLLKYMTLERYADELESKKQAAAGAEIKSKADTTLERESRDRVTEIWNRRFKRLTEKYDFDEKFNTYVNTISELMDPHTQFFPPVEKRAFDEAMSGRFFGIGAQLTGGDGKIKIASVITGSPAWKTNEIQVNDEIVKVAQGEGEPVDVTGFEVTDAVKIIRGEKGTEVRLHMKKPDGTVKVVPIIRDEIVQEETFARSVVVNGENKIGYIYLPEFYANFEDPRGARSARDVANEVKKLMDQKVDGIVIDLRFNGGGSLQDVISMVGLFIDEGPVVQVKDRYGDASVYRDRSKGILYDGPLAVMINEYSASASEIFAAAIQDYKRGIIIGTQSYGKGTVQRNLGLDPKTGFFSSDSELGSLKLTLQKFYRINGGSTQLMGVKPDITLHDNFEFTKSREKDDPNALPYDEIAAATYQPWIYSSELNKIEIAYKQRLDTSSTFKQIKQNAEFLSRSGEEPVPLSLSGYTQRQEVIKEVVKKNEKLQTLGNPMDLAFMPEDESRINAYDDMKKRRFQDWLKGLKTDIYLKEASHVMDAMITQEKLVKK